MKMVKRNKKIKHAKMQNQKRRQDISDDDFVPKAFQKKNKKEILTDEISNEEIEGKRKNKKNRKLKKANKKLTRIIAIVILIAIVIIGILRI